MNSTSFAKEAEICQTHQDQIQMFHISLINIHPYQ